jgi:hypothetical protein
MPCRCVSEIQLAVQLDVQPTDCLSVCCVGNADWLLADGNIVRQWNGAFGFMKLAEYSRDSC